MKNGMMYAARLKKAYAALRHALPKAEIPPPDDPIRRLGHAMLGVDCHEAEAERRIERLLGQMVDWNEVRVSLPLEVAAVLEVTTPEMLDRCARLVKALQAIYKRENRISLDRLHTFGKREAKQYLEELDGMDVYAVASVALWSLGGHAVPVNDPLLAALREAELVNPASDRAAVQAFLERHVHASQVKEFCIHMRSFHAKHAAMAKTKGADGDPKRLSKASKSTS
jgi:hypothetical protein